MDIEGEEQDDELELNEEMEADDQAAGSEPDDGDDGDAADDGDTVIGFSDDPDEHGDEETPLVKKLREQIRDRDRKLAQRPGVGPVDDDPEPVIPPLKRSDDDEFGYDPDKHAEYIENRDAKVAEHAAWKARQGERDAARKRVADDQAKRVEQQRNALGVNDYEERANAVRDRLSDQQMAVLIHAVDNPARLLYALGRSEARLDELAGIDNLARFAARIGQMDREIKVTKRKAPAPESQVRGATASTAVDQSDRKLASLEKEAARTGDRTKVVAYKRELRKAAA